MRHETAYFSKDTTKLRQKLCQVLDKVAHSRPAFRGVRELCPYVVCPVCPLGCPELDLGLVSERDSDPLPLPLLGCGVLRRAAEGSTHDLNLLFLEYLAVVPAEVYLVPEEDMERMRPRSTAAGLRMPLRPHTLSIMRSMYLLPSSMQSMSVGYLTSASAHVASALRSEGNVLSTMPLAPPSPFPPPSPSSFFPAFLATSRVMVLMSSIVILLRIVTKSEGSNMGWSVYSASPHIYCI